MLEGMSSFEIQKATNSTLSFARDLAKTTVRLQFVQDAAWIHWQVRVLRNPIL